MDKSACLAGGELRRTDGRLCAERAWQRHSRTGRAVAPCRTCRRWRARRAEKARRCLQHPLLLQYFLVVHVRAWLWFLNVQKERCWQITTTERRRVAAGGGGWTWHASTVAAPAREMVLAGQFTAAVEPAGQYEFCHAHAHTRAHWRKRRQTKEVRKGVE
jgi:hypothetical protein